MPQICGRRLLRHYLLEDDVFSLARLEASVLSFIKCGRVPKKPWMVKLEKMDFILLDCRGIYIQNEINEKVKALVEKDGLKDIRFVTSGYGAKQPVAPNTKADGSDDPEGRAKNRRVELVVRKTSP